MGRVLDRSKSYGTVIGDDPNGAKFRQGGIDFDYQGMQIGEDEPVADEPVAAPESRVDVPSPIEAESVEVPDMPLTAPRIKNWTLKAVINHMQMRFPDAEIDPDMDAPEMKTKLRGLYAAAGAGTEA